MNRPERLPGILADLLATDETEGQGLRPRSRRREDAPRRATQPAQRSLFGEILDWMMVPLLLLWPMSVAITFVVARSIADAPYDRSLQERVRVIAQQVRFDGGRPQVLLSQAARELLRGEGDEQLYYQFMAPGGEVLLGERDLGQPVLYSVPDPGRVLLRQDQLRGEELRVAYLFVQPEDAREGLSVLVQLAETQERRTQLANEIIKGVILPQFLILPVALALVWFGLGRGLRPLKLMQRGIQARRPDDFSPIDPKSVPQEISPLVDAFNDLLGRLEQSVSVQKRFIADAAHQMKTPLAGLRMQAELALRESDPKEVHKSLEQIARGSERAAHLTSQLLALARTENLRKATTFEQLDLNALTRRIVTEWADKALHLGIDFGFESADVPAPIAGHPLLLHELFNNLIDNALRYTPRGGVVTVRVRPEDDHACVDIEDSGPGIPEHERTLVFERFYRVLGTQVDGSGLGLPIVKEIAAHHAATVRIEDTRPGASPPGTRVTVQFERPLEA